jgi:hypothetical protein
MLASRGAETKSVIEGMVFVPPLTLLFPDEVDPKFD